MKQKTNLMLTLGLLAAVLAVKIICFSREYPMHYEDLAQITMSGLSGLYYVLMLGLCFFAGREKWGYSILLCTFLVKLLILGIAAMAWWEPMRVVFWFVSASHYLVTATVNGFESVGETIPDIIYWGAYVGVYLCLAAVAWLGKYTKRGSRK